MKQPENKSRTAWIDYMKALAIILVIMDHSMDTAAKSSLGYYYIVRMAVPIFVLISGYNFSAVIEKMSSVSDWYHPERLREKLIHYLSPMLIVFISWLILNTIRGRFTVSGTIKAFCLQNYGMGAYYFWIIVQLYLIFPILYYLIRRWKSGGYFTVFCLNFLYEIILWFFPIQQSVYRIIGLRYMMILALGIWIYDEIKNSSKTAKTTGMLITSFILGCLYIGFFIINQDNPTIFPYSVWPNTNFLCSLYIVPMFYALAVFMHKKRIKIDWLHNMISLIGQSSYFIFCTQMVMFWAVGRIWTLLNVSVFVSIIFNIILASGSGIFIYLVTGKWKTRIRSK